MNIPELRLKVKEIAERLNTRELYTILLIIAVGTGSFGLGRLSKLEEARIPIRIEQTIAPQTASALSSVNGQQLLGKSSPASGAKPLAEGGKVVASRGGSRYHFPWCSGAQRISETNKVWFDSVEEARKAGYTPANNCKGLK